MLPSLPFQSLRIHWLFAREGINALFLLFPVAFVPMFLCRLMKCLGFGFLDGIICDLDDFILVTCFVSLLLL